MVVVEKFLTVVLADQPMMVPAGLVTRVQEGRNILAPVEMLMMVPEVQSFRDQVARHITAQAVLLMMVQEDPVMRGLVDLAILAPVELVNNAPVSVNNRLKWNDQLTSTGRKFLS